MQKRGRSINMRIAAFCFAVLFAAMLLIPSIFAMLGREIQTENGAENSGQKNTEAIVDTDGRTSASGEETENIKNADASGTEISEKNEGITAQKHPLADDLKLDIVRQTVDDEVITVMLPTENGEKICTEMTLSNFLYGALLGEMPAGFDMEALRACAVAARSYVLYVKNQQYRRDGHEGADICGDYAHCMAYLSYEEACDMWSEEQACTALEKMKEAVDSTAGTVLTYDGEVCNAMFHSMSWKYTESASNLWNCNMPYLTSVETPETADLKGLSSEVRCSADKALKKLRLAGIEAEKKDLQNAVLIYNSSGRVDKVSFAANDITGMEIQRMFSLRSTEFSFSYDAERQEVVFSVLGFGHGVGMSQYGAELMAEEGQSWQSIVLHYYPGAALETFS